MPIYGKTPNQSKTLSGHSPLTFYSNGDNLTSCTIIGNGKKDGIPSPNNIIMPTFCGVRTGNLFDKSTITVGYYVNDTNGGVYMNPQYADGANASDYIPISGDYVSIYSNPAGEWRWGAFYDSNKTYLSGFSGYNKAVAIPANAAYMRLTVVDDILDTLMVNLGSTTLPYEPYGYNIRLVRRLPQER